MRARGGIDLFEYLGELSGELGRRYSTLENNMKSGSNSFYDTFREIIQDFIKLVLTDDGVAPKNVKISAELNSPELLGRLYAAGTEDAAVEKIRNYVLKTNDHVHNREKELTFEAAVNYLNALYSFTAPYALCLGQKPKKPTLDQIQSLYAEYEKNASAQKMFNESFEERFKKMEEDAQENRRERERAREERERRQQQESKIQEEQDKKRQVALIEALYKEFPSNICYFGSDYAFKCFKYALAAMLICFLTLNTIPYFMLEGEKIYGIIFYTLVCACRLLPFLYFFLFLRFITLRTENKPLFDNKTMFEISYFQPWNMDFRKRYTVGLVITITFDIAAMSGGLIDGLSLFGHWIVIIADVFAIAIYAVGRIFFSNFSVSHIEGVDRAGIYRNLYLTSGMLLTKEQFDVIRAGAGKQKTDKK